MLMVWYIEKVTSNDRRTHVVEVASASVRAGGVVWRSDSRPTLRSLDFSTNGCALRAPTAVSPGPSLQPPPVARQHQPRHLSALTTTSPPPPPACARPSSAATSCSSSTPSYHPVSVFPFTSSSFAAFVVRCTLVTPVYPPQQPCRLLALVGHFWRLLPRRRQHKSAMSPDLLNRFCTSTATAFAAPAAALRTIGFVCPLLTRAATANRPSNFYLA